MRLRRAIPPMIILLLSLCIAVLAWDALFLRVPNQLLLLALAVHIACLLMTGHGIDGIDIWQSLIGGAIGLAFFVPLYALRAMGAGDVKFFTLLGLLLGPKYLIPLWLVASLLAGVHAITFYLSRRGMLVALPGLPQIARRITGSATYRRILRGRQGREGIPYAAYLAVATIFTTVYRQL